MTHLDHILVVSVRGIRKYCVARTPECIVGLWPAHHCYSTFVVLRRVSVTQEVPVPFLFPTGKYGVHVHRLSVPAEPLQSITSPLTPGLFRISVRVAFNINGKVNGGEDRDRVRSMNVSKSHDPDVETSTPALWCHLTSDT